MTKRSAISADADSRLVQQRRGILSFGGLFGNHINKGETVIPFIEDKETLMKICDTAIQFFDDNAKAGERFKFTIDRVGREKFTNTILEVYNNG